MPLYDYRCTQCGKIYEVRHGFDQTHATPCEACGGSLARVFNPAPILFKGSGFYATDSRKPAAAESTSASESSTPAPAPAAAPAAGETKKASDSAA